MRRSLTAFAAVFLLTLTAAYAQNQQDKDTDKAQRLTTGRITNIDTKKRILKVRTATGNSESIPGEPQDPDRRRRNDGGFPGTGGRSGRTGGRRGGIGFPGGVGFPTPGGGGDGRPRSTPRNEGTEFKVTVTDKTVLKDGENRLSFLNLNVGDHIQILGLPKGSGDDLEATEISLTK